VHLANNVQSLNRIIDMTHPELITHTLYDLVIRARKDAELASLYNHAVEVWCHEFFFKCVVPGGRKPKLEMLRVFDLHFDGMDNLKAIFKARALACFGVGWVWLIADRDRLSIINTNTMECPIMQSRITPLLALDMWEHSYYLDFQERREEYVDSFWHVVDWDFVNTQLAIAMYKEEKKVVEQPRPGQIAWNERFMASVVAEGNREIRSKLDREDEVIRKAMQKREYHDLDKDDDTEMIENYPDEELVEKYEAILEEREKKGEIVNEESSEETEKTEKTEETEETETEDSEEVAHLEEIRKQERELEKKKKMEKQSLHEFFPKPAPASPKRFMLTKHMYSDDEDVD